MKVKVKQILVLVVNLSVSINIKASSSTGSNMNIVCFLIVEPNTQEGQQADTLTYTLYVINFKSAF